MNVFNLRNQLIKDYSDYVQSFIHINDSRIKEKVAEELQSGLLWPNPLIQLNPAFEPGETIPDLVKENVIHPECNKIFQKDKDEKGAGGKPLRLYKHQTDAIKVASKGHNYVLTTGTGSGKSLAYIIPIVDYVLKRGTGKGIKAIIVYPMNALANSQEGELQKFLYFGYPNNKGPVTFARYTGQERDEVRQQILANPPDILLTNYVMLELILTRPFERPLVEAAKGIQFLVFDELHTYRGRQGADVALLIRRAKDAFKAANVQCVGTSATVAGSGTYEEQQKEVASVASMVFGATVNPENVIGETLRRSTPEFSSQDRGFVSKLKKRIEDVSIKPAKTYKEFILDPLSSWIETVFGLTTESNSKRLIRTKPQSISGEEGAAKELGDLTGVPVNRCIEVIEEQLLGSYNCEPNPETGFPIFAFRLHQFISRGDTVYASIETEEGRCLTVRGQQYVPGDRNKILLPLVFCRECGQEYYSVRRSQDPGTRAAIYGPRELADRLSDEQGEAGFIYLSASSPWPEDVHEAMERLPDEWLEEYKGSIRIRPARQADLPRAIRVGAEGKESESGTDCHFISAPFRFCLNCGVSYGFRQSSDFPKLTSLASEGRSTATTILSLGAIQYLLRDNSLKPRARKLLSFTDNRQDASLQAGHFNDFMETGILRSAILKAAMSSGKEGMRHDDIVQRVFDALDLPIELYASDPDVRFQALEETKKALRAVLGYRLYRDLKRGWRVTAPNLEQCGLIEIKYLSLDEVCKAEDLWKNTHSALAAAPPETRQKVAKTLLDHMRRELAIKVDYLDQLRQEQIQQQSSQRLIAPWAIDENELMEHAAVLYPRSRTRKDYRGYSYLSPRGGFGQYVRRTSTFDHYTDKISVDETQEICRQLLEALRIGGLTEIVAQPRDAEDVPGYQIPASALLWVVADGSRPFYDPIRVPRASETGGRTNPFFIEFYKSIADVGKGLEAREHTAQVQYDARIERENRFREGKLPILFCSPTMELGVDIAELNAVNLRNMPPTPANYAQRSGRAGRSGQPALVFTYCSTFSSHDQYFFRRPNLMVAGSVTPPRLDLANEDLIRAHIHAIWLAASGLSLGTSLIDILNLEGEEPSLELLDSVKDSINSDVFNKRSEANASKILESIKPYFANADWFTEKWLQDILSQMSNRFEQSCERWRNLYRAAKKQYIIQNKIAIDHTRSQEDRNKAKRLSAEARSQLELLTEAKNVFEGDFYSYRYFASEGFLPGYNFPRLPLSAYIPGRRQKSVRDEFLSRPRFLAISEFGPRAIIYHEGSRYRINKVILPVEDQSEGGDVVTSRIKQCSECGYIHPIFEGDGPDLCECCNEALDTSLNQLFRIQNVATKRTDKINSDEEERLRIGYEIKTGIRFIEHSCGLSSKLATVKLEDEDIAELLYGDTATIWRMNLGWVRRAKKEQCGFLLDVERGYWAKNEKEGDEDDQDPMSAKVKRVIPYVEDRRNCLIYKPLKEIDAATLISLQAAFKNAIQVEYQLEESELAAEPLPKHDEPKNILLYEASEGGAGILKRLVEDPSALSRVAKTALQLCHFSDSGQDLRRAPGSKEDCEAACYDCLMSYTNQRDHSILDRQKIKEYLMELTRAQVYPSPRGISRKEHTERLLRQCQTGLEKEWIKFINEKNLRLPSRAQAYVESCKTSPDFIYDEFLVAVYVDGHPHTFADRQKRDEQQTTCMEDHGYTVIRFRANDDWGSVIKQYPNIFGRI